MATQKSYFLKRLAWASIFAVFVMTDAMIIRPLWRDEYWALYFSDTHQSLKFLITERMNYDTHPPLYFIIQHFWRGIIDHVLWMKLFSLLSLIGSGLLIWKIRKENLQTLLFFLMCVGSYWVIYFMAEIRPYILMFSLSALAVFYLQHLCHKIINQIDLRLGDYALWVILTIAISTAHYYGAIWISLCGLSLGIWAGITVKSRYFFTIGAASLLGIVPICIWTFYSLGTINFGQETVSRGDLFTQGLHQFLRGILGKTFLSNLGLSLLAIVGFRSWWQNKSPIDLILIIASTAMVILVFIVHVFIQPFIKERAFLVIMPALFFLMARMIFYAFQEKQIRPKLQGAALGFAVITPFLFSGEYFKDREKITQVRAAITKYDTCRGAPIGVYYRPSPQGDDFSEFYTKHALANLYASPMHQPRFIPITNPALTPRKIILHHACPVKILAMNLTRGAENSSKPDHIHFRAEAASFLSPTHKLDDFGHVLIGKGRNQLYLKPKTSLQKPSGQP